MRFSTLLHVPVLAAAFVLNAIKVAEQKEDDAATDLCEDGAKQVKNLKGRCSDRISYAMNQWRGVPDCHLIGDMKG